MVAAAVHAAVSSNRIESVLGTGFAERAAEPTLAATTDLAADAVDHLPEQPRGPVVAERGEFYEEPPWSVANRLDVELEFKYVETIAERETVQAAHHAAYGARRLLL
jgi:hypothetical protein